MSFWRMKQLCPKEECNIKKQKEGQWWRQGGEGSMLVQELLKTRGARLKALLFIPNDKADIEGGHDQI